MAEQAFIKPEPEEEKPVLPTEEDDMDEAGDLEFYDKNLPGNQFETLYLARIPRYMWDAWLKAAEGLGDDDEIQLGTLRTWNEPTPDASVEGGVRDVTKLRMLLNPKCPEHQGIPSEYDLDIFDRDVQNHFVFSEEDLPSYKEKNKARQEAIDSGVPAHLLRQREQQQTSSQQPGPQRSRYDRKSRYQPYFRKAIPKKTKIFGKIHYDVRVEPRSHREEEELLARRMHDAENSKSKLKIISRNNAASIINPGSAAANQWSGSFIKNAAQPVKPKKAETFKAVRIPKNQLLDLIFDCFRQYQYWSMKALRQKTQQPDSYLRQVLEDVAVLHKSGRFANHYGLSEAYKDKAGSDAKEEAAEAADDGDDEDDEDEELEDVLPAS